MFQANMLERTEGRVIIDDISSRVLKKMLAFMYTGEPPEFGAISDVMGLLEAASKYQLDALMVSNYLAFLVFLYFIEGPKNFCKKHVFQFV
jgi:hypothetical protein